MRFMFKALFVLTAVVFLRSTPSYAAKEINSAESYDNYTKTTAITTDRFIVPNVGSFFEPAFALASLSGGVSDAGIESIELLIYYSGTEWKFFSTSRDIDGNEFVVREIDRQVESASAINEQFTASLTRAYLETHKNIGLDIQFSGKYGVLVVKLPANYVQVFLARLEKVEDTLNEKLGKSANLIPSHASIERPKLGVGYLPVDTTLAKITSMDIPKGVYLAKVESQSIAANAGLKVGDVVLAIDGTLVPGTITGFLDAIANIKSGSRVSMTIWRNAKETIVSVQF